MKKVLTVAIALVMAFILTACNGKSNDGYNASGNTGQTISGGETVSSQSNVRVKLTFNDAEIIVKLYDNPTSRDFLTLLPLTIKVEDYAGTEKISYLPKKLTTQEAPAGSDPAVGDFTYYSPWGNLAIFYKDFGYANGLIILGKIESGIEKLANIKGNTTVKMEKID
ncbi:hypothetical protein SOV_10340 [Sporomusa ovata DSM 2662]|uniref:Similar to Uncharacterized conserved protein n=1 Tax=Sporomusa ovata TaxID=2378 RepID=A0A0U1KZ20_9FIRM|nr:cyclophilin-like fold protein [Sporomusa ovata]EQB28683.1 hypothetical protein SOV_1c03720 [Sporomusa ovata DSM 2662]CQR72193.1 similar to Uncharacterized conserved protein [Sporomusa ovata]